MCDPQPAATPRGRRDHLLPQGYLEGFTNPSKPGRLSVYSIERREWFESAPRGVAAIKGFYDYSPGSVPDQTADQSFREYEGKFPSVRRELVASGFSGWRSHLDFLLGYAQMLRARSQLFRQQTLADVRQRPMARVKEVLSDPVTGNASIKYEELTETREQREALFRNMTITTMLGEIAKGAAFFSSLHWRLRLAVDVANPVITGDDAVIVEGNAPTLEIALTDGATRILFPLCRHACLIGSPARFDGETEAFQALDLKRIQARYLGGMCRFAYSPKRLAL